MQNPRETHGEKELVVLNKGVQRGPSAFIAKDLSQLRPVQGT